MARHLARAERITRTYGHRRSIDGRRGAGDDQERRRVGVRFHRGSRDPQGATFTATVGA